MIKIYKIIILTGLTLAALLLYSCNPMLEVPGAISVTGVTLNKSSAAIDMGTEEQLTAVVEPEDAANKNVAWSSSNEAIAAVDENGVVSGIAAGNAEITVTTEDGGFTATCAVEVIEADTVPPAEITLGTVEAGGGEITLNWTEPDDPDFDHVEISWNPTVKVAKGIKSHTITGLDTAKKYAVAMRAVDKRANKSAGLHREYIPPAVKKTVTYITTAAQLDGIRNDPAGYYILGADIDIGVSPYIDGTGWAPIGDSGTPFTGTFDGNGFSIDNMIIDDPGSSELGLFGYNDGSLVRVEVNGASVTGYQSVGLVAGVNDTNGVISDSQTAGSFYISSNWAGGLVGTNNGTIKNSSSFASISVLLGNVSNIGGLVGYNSSTGSISDSNASGTIENDYRNTGGLVGYNSGSITNSHATGNVNRGDGGYIGGLVGTNDGGDISDSYAAGHVNADTSGTLYAGGLVGTNKNSSSILRSYATGDVSSHSWSGGLSGYNDTTSTIEESYASGAVNGTTDYLGGLVGYTYGDITDSYAAGSVGSGGSYIGGLIGRQAAGDITGCHAEGAVSGLAYVGGLIGEMVADTISYCYASGTVTGSDSYAGGLVAYQNGGTIEYSFASGDVDTKYTAGGLVGTVGSGTVTNTYAIGSSYSESSTGGLAGVNFGTIEYSYSTGQVSGTSGPFGGLIGDNGGTLTAGYYDTDTSAQSDTGNGEPKTTAEMKTQSTYTGWDFNTIWALGTGTNSGYPHLQDLQP